MTDDPDLAIFIHGLLGRAHSEDKDIRDPALECLDTYCEVTDADLRKLDIPLSQRALVNKCCTDTGGTNPTNVFLLDVPAYVAAKMGGQAARARAKAKSKAKSKGKALRRRKSR